MTWHVAVLLFPPNIFRFFPFPHTCFFNLHTGVPNLASPPPVTGGASQLHRGVVHLRSLSVYASSSTSCGVMASNGVVPNPYGNRGAAKRYGYIMIYLLGIGAVSWVPTIFLYKFVVFDVTWKMMLVYFEGSSIIT